MVSVSFGFDIYKGNVQVMKAAHRHQELELNVMFSGSMTYLFGGNTLELREGQVALFWATIPHRLISCEAGTECGWITLPLASFLRYGVPEHLSTSILHGRPVIDSFSKLEDALFNRWLKDVHPESDKRQYAIEKQSILELELQAWLRRMALRQQEASEPHLTDSKHSTMPSKAAQLAQFISENYQEPLKLQSIAEAVSLNPSYAATLFKRSFAMTLNDYLTQHRIAHAQRLLATTDMPILELAFEAGFGSSSQFYAAFLKACGNTPQAYRQTLTR